MLALRQRGDRFGGGLPVSGDFGNEPQTVWTMPTPVGRGAYQDIGGDHGVGQHAPSKPLPNAPSPAPAAPTMPHAPAPAPAPAQQPGGPPPGAFTI